MSTGPLTLDQSHLEASRLLESEENMLKAIQILCFGLTRTRPFCLRVCLYIHVRPRLETMIPLLSILSISIVYCLCLSSRATGKASLSRANIQILCQRTYSVLCSKSLTLSRSYIDNPSK